MCLCNYLYLCSLVGVCVYTCLCVCVPHSSVVSLGMPLGRECSALLLQRTTPSEHVQTSGHPDAGRQPLSSTPERGGKRESEWVMGERWRERKREGEGLTDRTGRRGGSKMENGGGNETG